MVCSFYFPFFRLFFSGKAVQQTTFGKTGNFGCMDIAGIQQENGAEYLRPSGKFKYKCSNGIEEVVGK